MYENEEENRKFEVDSCLKLASGDNNKKIKADALLLVPSTKNAYKIEEIIEKNYKLKNPFKLLGSDSMYQKDFVNINGKARQETEGMIIPISWHRSTDEDKDFKCNKESTEFECMAADILLNASEKQEPFRPYKVNWRTLTSYNAAKTLMYGLYEAKKRCGIFSNYSNCMRENLHKILNQEDQEIPGTYPQPIKFKNGDIKKEPGSTAILVQAKDGGFRRMD